MSATVCLPSSARSMFSQLFPAPRAAHRTTAGGSSVWLFVLQGTKQGSGGSRGLRAGESLDGTETSCRVFGLNSSELQTALSKQLEVSRRPPAHCRARFAPMASAMIAVTRLLMLTPSFSACFVSLEY